jgi:hypothetical protein
MAVRFKKGPPIQLSLPKRIGRTFQRYTPRWVTVLGQRDDRGAYPAGESGDRRRVSDKLCRKVMFVPLFLTQLPQNPTARRDGFGVGGVSGVFA